MASTGTQVFGIKEIAVATVGLACTILVNQFQQRNAIILEAQKRQEDAKYSFQRTLWETKCKEFQNAADLMGQLTVISDPRQFADTRNKFAMAYFGKLNLIDSPEVNKLCASYNYVLKRTDPTQEDDLARLEGLTQPLVEAMRKSIEDDLHDLNAKKDDKAG